MLKYCNALLPLRYRTSLVVFFSAVDDLGNYTANYLLEFHIQREFIAELKDTSSSVYKLYNESIGSLVSIACLQA